MFSWRKRKLEASPQEHTAAPVEPAPAHPVIRDTVETRRAAETDFFTGIGEATATNLSLGTMLRSAFGLVDEMAAFSGDFESSAEIMRSRADQFVASVCKLQSQSDVIEDRLATAATAVAQAHTRSRSALASVQDLTSSIDDIERVVNMIAAIAAHTNLLALNATIEAARAGAAGAGFRVVAGEVKSLSQETQRATDEIVASVRRIRQRATINTAEVTSFDSALGSLEDVFAAVRAAMVSQGEQTREIGLGSENVATLAQKVRTSAGRMQALGGTVRTMTSSAEAAATKARRAFARLTEQAAIVLRQGDGQAEIEAERWPVLSRGRLYRNGEDFEIRLLDISPNGLQIETPRTFPESALGETVQLDVEGSGVEPFDVKLLTPTTAGFEVLLVDPSPALRTRITTEFENLRRRYKPYVERAQGLAAEVSRIMEDALVKGTLTSARLFDTNYIRQGSAEPAEYRNAAVADLETLVQDRLEQELQATPPAQFCIIQDRNGFNPVHNRRYSSARSPNDPMWNMRHSRMRRMYNERVEMMASRNLRPFLVQSYTRDMGESIERCMEFDAPIFVDGRHWGALRLTYRLTGA